MSSNIPFLTGLLWSGWVWPCLSSAQKLLVTSYFTQGPSPRALTMAWGLIQGSPASLSSALSSSSFPLACSAPAPLCSLGVPELHPVFLLRALLLRLPHRDAGSLPLGHCSAMTSSRRLSLIALHKKAAFFDPMPTCTLYLPSLLGFFSVAFIMILNIYLFIDFLPVSM